MFEDILKGLNEELDELRPKRVKCEGLMERVQDREKKAKLSTQYDIIRQAIDRVCLCISILDNQVSVEISEDFSTVKFPRIVKQKEPAAATSQEKLV